MRLLANGENVMFHAESSGPPRQRYWIHSVWANGAVMVDGVMCRADNARLSWQVAIDVEIDGQWQPHDLSGSMQDKFEQIIWTMERAGIPKGLSWVEDKVGPCADPYSMKIDAVPVEWRVLKS